MIAGGALIVKVTGYTHPPLVQFRVMLPAVEAVNVPPPADKEEKLPFPVLPPATDQVPAVRGMGVMLSVLMPVLQIAAVLVALVYAMCVYVNAADVLPEHQLQPPLLYMLITAAVPVPVNETVDPAVNVGPEKLLIV